MGEDFGGYVGVDLEIDEGRVRAGVQFREEGGDDGGDGIGEEGDGCDEEGGLATAGEQKGEDCGGGGKEKRGTNWGGRAVALDRHSDDSYATEFPEPGAFW